MPVEEPARAEKGERRVVNAEWYVATTVRYRTTKPDFRPYRRKSSRSTDIARLARKPSTMVTRI
jgi:hypothetical protein